MTYTPFWGIFTEMGYLVTIRNSAKKSLSKVPLEVQQVFEVLVAVLQTSGPTGPHNWTNYGKLKGKKNKYHCHLTKNHEFVACWEYLKEEITIEVYYAGSHKDAPY